MRNPTVTATVALALSTLFRSLRTGVDPVIALDEQARATNVIPGSPQYDEAAELIGFPYCRALDLYVPSAMRDSVEKVHFVTRTWRSRPEQSPFARGRDPDTATRPVGRAKQRGSSDGVPFSIPVVPAVFRPRPPAMPALAEQPQSIPSALIGS